MNKLQKIMLIGGIWYFVISIVVFAAPTTVKVPQGGTGFSSTSPNSILVTGNSSTSPLIATSSNPLWIGSFTATSTSATSTLNWGLTIVGGGLRIVGGTKVNNPITFSDLNCSGLSNGGTLTTDGQGTIICAADDSGGGGSTPSGQDTQIQFNNGGSALGSSANLVFDYNNGLFGIASTTPFGQLSIEMGTSSYPFFIGDKGTSTPALVVLGNSRVGIGTSTPNSLFSVQGNALISGTTSVHALHATSTIQLGTSPTANFLSGLATSTLANGLNLTGGGFRVTGGTRLDNLEVSGAVNYTGTGTTTFAGGISATGLASSNGITLTGGTISTASTALTISPGTGSNTILNPTSGNVGIGTTTPGSLFSIDGVGNLVANATSTFYRGLTLPVINATSTTATSTFQGISILGGGLKFTNLNCSTFTNSGTLTTDSLGNILCSNDDSGGGGGTAQGADGTLQFATGGGFNSSGQLLWTNSNGRLGIATATPSFMFSIGATTTSAIGFYASSTAIVQEINHVNDASTMNINWNVSNQQRITLTGNDTITFTGGEQGGAYRLILCQDGTGNRIPTWPVAVNWSNSSTTPTLSTAVNRCDIVSFIRTQATGTPIFIGSSIKD